MIEAVHLVTLMPESADGKALVYLTFIRDAMYYCEINTPLRQAAFLAQIARDSHELHSRPKNAATTKYGSRGWLGLEGVNDYKRFSCWAGYDFKKFPQHVEKVEWIAYLAAFQWRCAGCNELADQWLVTDIIQKLKGKLEFDEVGLRMSYFTKAARILGAETPVPHL